jgi:hypothetical protein
MEDGGWRKVPFLLIFQSFSAILESSQLIYPYPFVIKVSEGKGKRRGEEYIPHMVSQAH